MKRIPHVDEGIEGPERAREYAEHSERHAQSNLRPVDQRHETAESFGPMSGSRRRTGGIDLLVRTRSFPIPWSPPWTFLRPWWMSVGAKSCRTVSIAEWTTRSAMWATLPHT